MPDYRDVPVPKQLRHVVRRILHADHSDEIADDVRPAPTGYSYLGWVYRGQVHAQIDGQGTDDFHDGFHIAGQIAGAEISVRYTGPVGHILAECTATGLTELTGIAGRTARNTILPLSETQLFADVNVSDGQHQTAFVDNLSMLAEDPHAVPAYVREAARRIEATGGRAPISEIAADLPVGQRQLERTFVRIVGVTPKYFGQVQQLNAAFCAMQMNDTAFMADLALQAGFYDQAHFTNAMRQFIGVAPAAYLKNPHYLLGTFLGHSPEFRALFNAEAPPPTR